MSDTPVFQTLHHICVVVRDIDKSVAYYESKEVGPWHDFPSLEAFKDDLQVPDPDAFLDLTYKYADLGNVQLQLCRPGKGESPQRDFLETHGEGVFHLGFSVPTCDAAEARAADLGLDVLLRGRRPDGSGFTYFDTADAGAGVVLQIRSANPSR
ncbi:Catechol 2,3-dioxygenase [Streptomyces sp. yr375]|uniref:VOC family protein n=1 Tax=Streptomyces sp. yr375 TaxID=1761906 RepID=UPI0008B07CBD|nr:VOC family protein [Streptomyces sp. yr375]SES49150.1 Catechol 2,3-dioxygenase [Streptomyces sp. yr375]